MESYMQTSQLALFPAITSAVSGRSIQYFGMTLPRDFHSVSAPIHIVSKAICIPASAAALSLCTLMGWDRSCSGGVWLWAFQDPTTGQGEPWTLCSSHEHVICHCPGCEKLISPYVTLCEQCA